MDNTENIPSFEEVQERFINAPGKEGVILRQENYAPYFLRMGQGVVIERGCQFFHPDKIVLDDDARINVDALIYGSGGVWIGRHARVGPRCFIHSANHDIRPGPLAFHERGYDYLPVFIGDNTLISANVSIMPGARIETGSFVAAGTVVPGKKYPASAQLYGTPARNRAPAPEDVPPAPDIVLIVPAAADAASSSPSREGPRWDDIARHLLTCLGLPQVAIVEAGSPLPESALSAIAFGPEGWAPSLDPSQKIDLWHLATGNQSSALLERTVNLPSGTQLDLPDRHVVSIVADGRGHDEAYGGLQQVLFWLLERLSKGSDTLTENEFREWSLLVETVGAEADGIEYWTRVASGLERRRPAASASPATPIQLDRKIALTSPDLMISAVKAAMSGGSPAPDEKLLALVRDVYTHSNTGLRLVAMGCCASLLGDDEILLAIRERLATDEWKREGVAFPHSKAGGPGFSYSPLVAIWLLMEARRADPTFKIPTGTGKPVAHSRALNWLPFANGALFDGQQKQISRSLVDNWLILHSASSPAGSQYRLEQSNYRPSVTALETLWLQLFRSIQSGHGKPLLRLRPWPAPYSAAMSVRYDVDRPISAQRIRELVAIQSDFANAPCGTWYYFTTDAKREVQTPQLTRSAQEVALHLQSAREALPGLGVTHHSAPTSDYWRGNASNAVLNERGASYCEFLSAQTLIPRPAWIGDDYEGCIGAIWTTPIHFPLEGDTANKTLAYFDRLAEEFRDALACGGHAIIGSHPDVDQGALAELLQRENISNVWFGTVADVIRRCQHVLSYGSIAVVASDTDGTIALHAKSPISDLQIELWHPDDATPDLRALHLTEFKREIAIERPAG